MARLARTGSRDDADPHIVIVGAGGSRAACPEGDRSGRHLPMMADLIDTVGLRPLLEKAGVRSSVEDFEPLYDDLATSGRHDELVMKWRGLFRIIFSDFAFQIPPQSTTTCSCRCGPRTLLQPSIGILC